MKFADESNITTSISTRITSFLRNNAASRIIGPMSTTMDIQTMQSMDWLFKKERIYLLAQFWQQRATLAEKEVSALKEQLAVANGPHDTPKISTPNNSDDLTPHRTSLEIELSAKDKEISQLVEDVRKLQTSIGKLQETTASQIARLEEELIHKRQHILRLESRLEAQKDYEDVKRQLGVCRSDKTDGLDNGIIVTCTSNTGGTTTATTTCTGTATDSDPLCDRIKNESNSQHRRNQSVSPASDLQGDLLRSSSRSSESTLPFPAGIVTATPPAGLQNVEQFGSFLGEEIVANWRRSLERTIISQSSSCTSPPPSIAQSTVPSTLTLPPSVVVAAAAVKSFQLPPSPTNTSPVPHSPPPLPSLLETADSHKVDYSHDAQECLDEIGLQSKSIGRAHSELSDKDGPNESSSVSRNDTPKSIENVVSPTPSLDNPHSHRGDGTTPCKSPASSSDHELTPPSNNNSPHLNHHHHHHHHQQHQQLPSHHPLHHNSNNNNNNNSSSNNNNLPPGLINGLCGINMGLNNNLPMNFDVLKSQFRFGDDPRSPFRFGDDPGAMVGRYGESLIPKGDPMEARLQEMLRYNMDKYSTQNLDTLHIARRVRELLSIHNVGQRLFAKYVLGLSQGTVSELLSKPKPWDKLTEKGRDSYRKMHAWACDENAILLLKSLIPKKDPGMPNVFSRGDSDITDERIAHILNEASSHLIKSSSHQNQDQETRSNEDSKSPNRVQCPSPINRDGSSRKPKKYDHDDVSHDQVLRIYQEELAKLMGRRLEEHTFPGFMFPPFFGRDSATSAMNNDDIRLSLDAYHRELAKLQQNCPPGQISQNMSGLLGLHPAAAAAAAAAATTSPNNNNLSSSNGNSNGGSGGGVGGGGITTSISALGVSNNNTNNSSVTVAAGSGGSSQPHPAVSNGIIQDLSLPKSASERVGKSETPKLPNGDISNDKSEFKKESSSSSSIDGFTEAMKHAGSAFSLVRPKTEPGSQSASSLPLGNSILPPEDFSPSASVSPLQRMASITNSLISQPPTPHHHSPSQRPLKAVLPPITQQQFDQFNNLNTEEIVRKVKEQLSQFSISQRLFGESVLGLSQGSVSDLLARPKPWHMLTQKGREPFIRMKMFLEDENAVNKLVASQYKIAPEKLMRTAGYGGPTVLTPGSLGKPLPPTNCVKMSSMMEQLQKSDSTPERVIIPQHNFLATGPSPVHPPPPSPIFSNSAAHPLSSLDPFKKYNLSPAAVAAAAAVPASVNVMSPSHNLNALRNIGQHISPSVYEMAALTQELDTQTITTKIKEALLANNIGQKIFGEAVLGLSQGSVSELLSKPKPWHMLSIKGREPFIRMQLWLSDSHNIERLQALKTERRELNKRRRGSGQDNSSDTSSNDTSEYYASGTNSPPSAAKKQRVLFSEEQKEALRLAFALDPYPSVATIEFLATELGLASRTITNWFHNHRMRLKQQSPHANDPVGAAAQMNRDTPSGNGTGAASGGAAGSGVGFDPVQFRLLLSQRLGFSAALSSLPFPNPYFPPNANAELAALMSRNMLPTSEQLAGLDLSLKRGGGGGGGGMSDDDEDDDDDDMDDSRYNSAEDSGDESTMPEITPSIIESRSSRRKPAAPQWVNPDWQEQQSEVIINGVCVMQTDDFSPPERQRTEDGETVHVEPKAAASEIDSPPMETDDNGIDEMRKYVEDEDEDDEEEEEDEEMVKRESEEKENNNDEITIVKQSKTRLSSPTTVVECEDGAAAVARGNEVAEESY